MKIVLSGSTGFIGGEVLLQCLSHPSITSIIVLSRRDLDPSLAENPKVSVVIVKDFESYGEAAIDQLSTADAAVWCIGTYDGDEKIDIEYPLEFLKVVASTRTRSSGDAPPFRFVHLGGAFTEPPPKEGETERSLWFLAKARRIRGTAEARVLEYGEQNSHNGLSVIVAKPGGILHKKATTIGKCVLGNSIAVGLAEVGAVMVDLAIHGSERKICFNRDIVEHAKRLQLEC